MRFATLPDGARRDGRAVLVSQDGTTCRPVGGYSLLELLDMGVGAERIEEMLGAQEPFVIAATLAPLPRAVQFLDGSAYVNHVDLVRRARGQEVPERFWSDPLMYQGTSVFLPAHAPIPSKPKWGTDCEAEVAVITRDVPRGATPEQAAKGIALVTLIDDISLRLVIPDELSKGFGFVHGKPPNAMAAMAVTPDALPGWDGRKLHGALRVDLNGQPFGRADAGQEMTFDFGQLVAHAAHTRDLPAGTVIGSGTVSNRGADGSPGRPVSEGGAGYSCLVEQRVVETLQHGAPRTPFLAPGDRVEIWMEDAQGRDIFGRINQIVETA